MKQNQSELKLRADASMTKQHVKVICLILTKIKQTHAADSLRAPTLMPLSVLPWAHQLPGLRLTQLSQGERVPCGRAMEQKGQRSAAFRLKEGTGEGEVKAAHSCDPQRGL